jgi:LmbE family N-acetylglucosaminyl deacetylase
MLSLQLADPRTFLCIGAHCDDIEIGCGGTLSLWAHRYPRAMFVWAVFSADATRADETRAAAAALLGPAARFELRIHDFRDSFFPAEYGEIKESVAALRREVAADVVLTHSEHDRHQDHRTLSELTWSAFRDQLVLEYEIPKYDGDLGRPNLYVPLPVALARRKAECLPEVFASQSRRDWFTADTFLALMRLRGVECRAESGFAEAFYARKVVLGS